MPGASSGFEFPALRGIQAGRAYFVAMVPWRLLSQLFMPANDLCLAPHLRAQRVLNKARLPELTRYILEHRRDYVFSALTASVDGSCIFTPAQSTDGRQALRSGCLRIGPGAKVLINDGQHRLAAIERALRRCPELADETIVIVFYRDHGLRRSQQIFADLNRFAIRPSASLSLLYDHRNRMSAIVRAVVQQVEWFGELVECERSSLSNASPRLFTFSAIYAATRSLLAGCDDSADALTRRAVEYWNKIGKHMIDWQEVRYGRLKPCQVRTVRLSSHAVVLQALGQVGNQIITEYPLDWQRKLIILEQINWNRDNPELQGVVVIGGRVSKSLGAVAALVELLCRYLALNNQHNICEANYE